MHHRPDNAYRALVRRLLALGVSRPAVLPMIRVYGHEAPARVVAELMRNG